MNKSTRTAAVAATFALATIGVQGVANAQSVEQIPAASLQAALGPILTPITGSIGQAPGTVLGSSEILGTGSAGVIPSSAELDPLEGSSTLPGSSGASSALPALSSEPLGGSAALPTLSSEPLGGSAALPATLEGSLGTMPLSSELLGGSAALPALSVEPLGGSAELGPLSTELLVGSGDVGSKGMQPLSTELITGSEGMGSKGMQPLSTELDLLGGSAELPPLSANFPDGSTGGIGGSAEEVGAGVSGSLTNGSANQLSGSVESNSADPIIGSIADGGGLLSTLSGSLQATSDSVSGTGGSTGGSAQVLTGSFGDLTQVNGSLTALTGSLENGSTMSALSTNMGSLEGAASLAGESGSAMALLPVLSLGGTLALAGTAMNGGVAFMALPSMPGLPPLPTVCDLPKAQVDQLAGAGSADAQRCPTPEN